jgi:4-hydroxy-2-oxoheptanedioate aldolase
VYVGPSDLSMSLGKPPTLDPSDAEVVSLIELIAKKTRAKGLIAGVHCDGSKTALRRFGQGYQLATILNDARLMATAAAQAVKEVKGGAPVVAPKTY